MSTLRILHLTDTHLFGDDSRHYGVVDTADHLRRALAHVGDRTFDIVVCSGDVSEDGTEASYVWAHDIIATWAAERGARAIFAMGNHDKRASFRAVLGDGQPGVRTSPLVSGPERARPVSSVASVAGWRTIVLDTSVPLAGYGALETAQLDALAEVLAQPAEHGTVIVMHHPPARAETDLLQALALDEESAAGLWARIRGTDVKAVLCGHYHHAIFETVFGIPVLVAPGVTNLAAAFDGPEEESAADWFGGAVVEISDGRVRALPFTEPVTGAEVFRFSTAEVAQIIDAAGRP